MITIRIYQSDLELLRSVHDKFGYNRVIRQLVRNYCESLERKLHLEEVENGSEY